MDLLLSQIFNIITLLIVLGLLFLFQNLYCHLKVDLFAVLDFNTTICNNLTSYFNSSYEDKVQLQVTEFNIIGGYIQNLPTMLVTLYLGPLSDHGRKFLMYLPFVGHFLSGIFTILFVYFESWPAQYLWLSYAYVLFGGYSVLQIAMYGYIGDVTSHK